jgi:hypothetical protein
MTLALAMLCVVTNAHAESDCGPPPIDLTITTETTPTCLNLATDACGLVALSIENGCQEELLVTSDQEVNCSLEQCLPAAGGDTIWVRLAEGYPGDYDEVITLELGGVSHDVRVTFTVEERRSYPADEGCSVTASGAERMRSSSPWLIGAALTLLGIRRRRRDRA